MFTTVIVPLDGSTLSESALRPGQAVARRLGVPLQLLSSSWGGTTSDSEKYLGGVAAELDVEDVRTVVVADQFAVSAIRDAAEAEEAPLICMATHGRTGIGRALLGSTAEEVIRSVDGPVLLVGPKSEPLPDGGPTDLVVTLDGSFTAATALDMAKGVAATLGLSIVVVTVLDGEDTSDDPHRVDATVAELVAGGIDARAEILRGKDAAGAIADLAHGLAAPMLCMATHGRGGMQRTALGSVAMRVVHQVTCPVLVARPAEPLA